MSTRDFDALLTPAARQMLTDLVTDLRQQLVQGAAETALRETGALREISVADLARSYTRLQSGQRSLRRGIFERALTVYSISGVLIGAVGAALYVYNRFLSPEKPLGSIDMAVAAAFAGVVFYFLTTYLQKSLRSRESWARHLPEQKGLLLSESLVGQFLLRWTDLEVALRAVASTQMGESVSRAPLSELAANLRSVHALPDSAMESLTALVQLRNKLVHSPGEVPAENVVEGIAMADTLLSRLLKRAPVGSA